MEIGVEVLDAAVGGITAGLPLVVEVDQGAGRNALFLQIVGGALDRGEQVVFLTAEPPSILLHQAAAMEIDLDAPLREERLILLEMEPAAPSLLRGHGVQALLDDLDAVAPRATFLAVNPFTGLTAEILDEPQLRSVTRDLQSGHASRHLVLGVDTDELDQGAGLRRVLLESCGAYVRVVRKYGPHFALQVDRLRVGEPPEEPIPFRLTSRGAVMEAQAPETPRPSEDPAPAETRVPTRPPRPEDRRPAVLAIDGDPEARTRYADWLSDRYDVVAAPNGSEGLALFMEARPDVVLLDLDLPQVNGFDLLRALGRAAEWVPVIVVSGRIRRPIDRVRPFMLGASDVIAKPADRFDLVRKVDALARAERPPPEYADFAKLRRLDQRGSVLAERQFRARCEAASLIVRRFDVVSSLLALECDDPDVIEHVVRIADDELRMEDAMCVVGEGRALFLLIGAPRAGAVTSAARLHETLGRAGVDAAGLRGAVVELSSDTDTTSWSPFFKSLEPWTSLCEG